ncbi:Ring canal kelch protein [Nymphon striatum]|nr:Ring canal kelch protein [Nymphon striatum]
MFGALPTLNMPKKSHGSVKSIIPRRSRSVVDENNTYTSKRKKYYKSFEDLRKKVKSLKSIKKWDVQELEDRLILKKVTNSSLLLPEIEMMIDDSLGFTVSVYGWLLPEDHELYTRHLRSISNITVSGLVNNVNTMTTCPGVKPTYLSSRSSEMIHHVIPKRVDPLFGNNDEDAACHNVFPHTDYWRTSGCAVLSKTDELCDSCHIYSHKFQSKEKFKQKKQSKLSREIFFPQTISSKIGIGTEDGAQTRLKQYQDISKVTLRVKATKPKTGLIDANTRQFMNMCSDSVFLEVKHSSETSQNKLETILNFSKINFLTDFQLEVNLRSNSVSRGTIKVNRCVLASGSSYFLEKFRENPDLNNFEINGFKLENVKKIFDFFYSDSIIINKNDLNEIFRLAKLFQLDRLLDNVNDNLNVENVLNIRDLWMSCDKMEEVKICDQFIEKNLDDISKLQIFKVIEFNYLKLLMKSSNLVVPDEKRIFEIAIEWLNVDIQTRKQFGQQLMEDVRFPLMPTEFLLQISEHEIIQNVKSLRRITESIHYSHKKEFRIDQNIITSVDITPRKYQNVFGVMSHSPLTVQFTICSNSAVCTSSVDGYFHLICSRVNL